MLGFRKLSIPDLKLHHDILINNHNAETEFELRDFYLYIDQQNSMEKNRLYER